MIMLGIATTAARSATDWRQECLASLWFKQFHHTLSGAAVLVLFNDARVPLPNENCSFRFPTMHPALYGAIGIFHIH
jgi:hypothetical protein